MVQDGFAAGEGGDAGGDDDGWLRTGGLAASQVARMKDVRTVDDSGEVGEKEVDRDDEEEIPDMEDEEDDEEAIIRDPRGNGGNAYVWNISLFPTQFLVGYISLTTKNILTDLSEHTPSTSPTPPTTALPASTYPATSLLRNPSPRTS